MPRPWQVPSRRIAIGRSVSRSSTADPAGPASVIFARWSITSNPTGSAKTNSRVARGPCEVGSRQGAPVLVEHACRQAGRPTLNGQLYDLRRERNRRGSRSVRRRRRGGVRRTFATRNHDEHGQDAELRSPSEPSGGRSRQRGQKYGRAQPSSGPNPGRLVVAPPRGPARWIPPVCVGSALQPKRQPPERSQTLRHVIG